MKKALITGITGQDGYYLTKLLLEKGYEIHGIVRRNSQNSLGNLEHLSKEEKEQINIHWGDITDNLFMDDVVKAVQPDEVYHLAAQSFVGFSFKNPRFTYDVNIGGTLNVANAIKEYTPSSKLYFAATSELYGKVQEIPQKETTPFYPRSPYGVSKLAGFWTIKNYRESYDLFMSNGILFNHESIPKNSPLILKLNDGMIDILPIEDLFRTEKHRYEGMLNKYKDNTYVWNGDEWTKLLNGTCYQDSKKPLKLIQTRESCYEATYDHVCFTEDNDEVKTQYINIGDKVYCVKYPKSDKNLKLDGSLAKFIGFLVGDGYIDERGRIRLTGTDKEQLIEMAELLTNKFGWSYRLNTYGPGSYENCKKEVWQLDINNDAYFGLWLKDHIYTRHSKEKRVPIFILNSDVETKKMFFDGYYLADGRNNGNEKYKYKGFTTSSATLCLGLIFVFKHFSNQTVKCKCEYREGRRYYYVQFRAPNPTGKGEHLRKDLNEVIKIIDTESPDGWFFDIQTESQTFATGPNLFKIHNSPMRGPEFVTRKITIAVAKIYNGLQDFVELGNLSAKRDWGYAGDYVYGMWKILQHDKPDDFVLATNETHTVREFVENAFKVVGIDIEWEGEGVNEVGKDANTGKVLVKVNPEFFRPAEVDILIGDYSKAKKELGWEPKVKFEELVKMMVEKDLERIGNK